MFYVECNGFKWSNFVVTTAVPQGSVLTRLSLIFSFMICMYDMLTTQMCSTCWWFKTVLELQFQRCFLYSSICSGKILSLVLEILIITIANCNVVSFGRKIYVLAFEYYLNNCVPFKSLRIWEWPLARNYHKFDNDLAHRFLISSLFLFYSILKIDDLSQSWYSFCNYFTEYMSGLVYFDN